METYQGKANVCHLKKLDLNKNDMRWGGAPDKPAQNLNIYLYE